MFSKKTPSSPLHQYIATNNIEEIKKYLDKNTDLSSILNDQTPIEYAAVLGKWEIVLLLAGKKADDYNKFHFAEALQLAVENDPEELAAIALIIAKTDLTKNINNINSYTILHLAIDKKRLQVIKTIINTNPDLLKLDSFTFRSPIIHAIDLAIKARYFKNEDLAAEYWNIVEMIIPLIKEAINNETTLGLWGHRYGLNEALSLAAGAGNWSCMVSLIYAGAVLNPSRLETDYSAFDAAVKHKHLPEAGLCLYLCPELENRDFFESFLNNYANQKFINHSKLWAKNLHLLMEKLMLLLKATLSTNHVFSQISRELYPLLFLNLILSTAQESLSLTNKCLDTGRITKALANIHLSQRKSSVINNYKERFLIFGPFTTNYNLGIFINDLQACRTRAGIEEYIKNFIKGSANWDEKHVKFMLDNRLMEQKEQPENTAESRPTYQHTRFC